MRSTAERFTQGNSENASPAEELLRGATAKAQRPQNNQGATELLVLLR